MATEKEIKTAKEVYKILLEAMDIQKWTYDAREDELTISFGVNGEDIPMEFVVMIDATRQVIRLFSKLPFCFDEAHRIDGAIATNIINYMLADGSFDYGMEDGDVIYRMTSSFRASMISPEVFLYLVNFACQAVDEFNDKLLMVSKGQLDPLKIVSDN